MRPHYLDTPKNQNLGKIRMEAKEGEREEGKKGGREGNKLGFYLESFFHIKTVSQ